MHVDVGAKWADSTGLVATCLAANESANVAAGATAAVLKLGMRMARIEEQAVPFWASLPLMPVIYSNWSDPPARIHGPAPPTSCVELDPIIATAAS